MRRLAVLAAFVGALLTAAPSEAQFVPGTPSYSAIFGHHASVYTPPDLSSGLAAAFGDSRVNLAGGLTTSTTNFNVTVDFGQAWASQLTLASGNVLLYDDDYNEGVSGQTSAGVAGRTRITGNDCNSPSSATTLYCWSGVRLATNLLANSGSTSLQFAATTGVVAGEYVFPNSLTALAYPTTVSGSPSGTVVTLSQATIASIASGQNITFSPAAKTSPFWTYGGNASAIVVSDMDLSLATTGRYSPCTNPANVVFAMFDTNDASMTSTHTLTNNNYVLDQFGPSLCNKLVILGNELPRGAATAFAELQTIASGAVTVTHAATYYDDVAVYYAPAPSAGAPGTNDGVKLTNCGGCGSPTVGQYAVNTSTGVYTFNTAENGLRLAFYYRWKTNAGGAYLVTAHNQLSSSTCGTFVDPSGGGTFPGISGALCNRPWAVLDDTWSLAIDLSSGSNNYPLPYYSLDGLHPAIGFARKIANSMVAAATPYIGSTKKFTAPTTTNPYFTGTSASSSSTAGAGSCSGVGNNTLNYFITSLSPAASTGVYAVGMKVYMTATTLITQGTTIDCIDTANNKFHMVLPAGAAIGGTAGLAQADATNLLGDGGMDHRSIITTAVASCNTHCGTPSLGTTITQGVPTGWSFALSAADTTAINAGTFGVNYGVETNPFSDGQDDFAIQVLGVVGASAMDLSVQQNLNTGADTVINAGDRLRAFCKVRISAGPNGRLWGLSGVSVKATVSSSAFQAPGSSLSNWTAFSAGIGNRVSVNQMTDAVDLAGGDLILEELSPPVDTATMSGMTVNFKIDIAADPGVAVSATLRLGQCWFGKTTR